MSSMVFSTVPLQSRWGNLHPEPLLKAQSPPPRAVLLRPPDPIAPAATGQAPLLPTGPSVSIHGPYPHTEHGKTGPLSHRGWGHPLTRRSPSVATAACVAPWGSQEELSGAGHPWSRLRAWRPAQTRPLALPGRHLLRGPCRPVRCLRPSWGRGAGPGCPQCLPPAVIPARQGQRGVLGAQGGPSPPVGQGDTWGLWGLRAGGRCASRQGAELTCPPARTGTCRRPCGCACGHG